MWPTSPKGLPTPDIERKSEKNELNFKLCVQLKIEVCICVGKVYKAKPQTLSTGAFALYTNGLV